MRLWYKSKQFRPVADHVPPAKNALIEEYVGTDPDRLTFPNVSTCTTITVVLDDDTLVGTHLSALCTTDDIDKIVARMRELSAGHAARRVAVLGVLRYVGGVNQRGGVAYTSQPEYAWPTKLDTIAAGFGLTRTAVQYFDQGMGAEKHYQVRAIGGGALTAFQQDVGQRRVGTGTASKPFSPSDPWMGLSLLDYPNA